MPFCLLDLNVICKGAEKHLVKERAAPVKQKIGTYNLDYLKSQSTCHQYASICQYVPYKFQTLHKQVGQLLMFKLIDLFLFKLSRNVVPDSVEMVLN